MFHPLPLFIGLRYTRSKQKTHFVSFISLVSMLGIALGVTALITVLSVMNGFEKEIKARILGTIPHVTFYSGHGMPLFNWQTFSEKISEAHPEVTSVTPFTHGQGLLTHEGRIQGTLIHGIDPQLSDHHFTDLKSGEFNIVVSRKAANILGLQVGDSVNLVLPEPSITPVGMIPRFKRFTVVDIFQATTEMESSIAYLHIHDANRLFFRGIDPAQVVSGIYIRLSSLYAAPRIAEQIKNAFSNYEVSNWTEEYGNYFEAVKLEKTIMFLMLLLIVAVAAFNLVSTLVMVVTDKTKEIAILRTLGATPRFIMQIFMICGGMIGFVGTLLGLVGGVILALNVTELVSFIEGLFKVQFLSADVYFISFLPSELEWQDVIKICSISLIMSFLATLYPAWQASQIQPAEALRYE